MPGFFFFYRAVLWNSSPSAWRLVASFAILFTALESGKGAESLTIQLPLETQTFRRAPGFEIANAQCLVCHSEDYVAIQPPLPVSYWKSNVQKMQQKYGADIPDEQVEPLA